MKATPETTLCQGVPIPSGDKAFIYERGSGRLYQVWRIAREHVVVRRIPLSDFEEIEPSHFWNRFTLDDPEVMKCCPCCGGSGKVFAR